jgi:glyoxylase-like metal-dependent hydrolase (beta-lactamase superfamily II)
MERFPLGGLFYGEYNAGETSVPFGFIAMTGFGHTVLIDTGYKHADYGAELAEHYGVVNWIDPAVAVEAVGVKANQVDTIILTHAHWDHAGRIDGFPNAKIFVQSAELSGWLRILALPQRFDWLRSGIDPANVHHLLERSVAGQVELIDGNRDEILPGVDVRLASDTHTPGHQYVTIRTENGPFVATGDCVYAFANLEGRERPGVFVPIGTAIGSQLRVLETFDQISSFVDGQGGRVIPVHDDVAWTRFPSSEVAPQRHLAEVTLAKGEPSRLRT